MSNALRQHHTSGSTPCVPGDMHTLPEIEDIAGFVCQALRIVPGIEAIGMCVRGHVSWSRGGVSPACPGCGDLWNGTDDALGRRCQMTEGAGIFGVPIETDDRRYGFLWFTLADPRAFAPWKPHAGNLANIIGKALESQRHQQKLEAQLRQAQKMEAIGQLAGGVAHDFNNILTAILGNVEVLRLAIGDEFGPDSGLSSRVMKGLGQIEQASGRAASLTRQLLAFSRRQASQPKVLDPNRLLRDLEPMLRRLLNEDIVLRVSTGDRIGHIRADAGQIEQLLINLAVNARDAMVGGGKLCLATSDVTLDEPSCAAHPDARPGRHVVFAVSDTGCGMDQATLERIFEPFFTTKPLGRGTGLGLSTAYAVAQQTGGHVRVYSEPGRGTTFRVFLPTLNPPGEQPAASEVPADVPTGRETVLVCEDEETVRELTGQMLEHAGYTVLTATDGPGALHLARRHAGPIHLLVTDIVMPEMNGRQLAEALCPERPDMRVLYVSGYTSDVIAHHGVLDEATELLEKPFSYRALLGRVRQVLDTPAAARA